MWSTLVRRAHVHSDTCSHTLSQLPHRRLLYFAPSTNLFQFHTKAIRGSMERVVYDEDMLDKIFDNFSDRQSSGSDKETLKSCVQVCRKWFEPAARVLWRRLYDIDNLFNLVPVHPSLKTQISQFSHFAGIAHVSTSLLLKLRPRLSF